MQRGFNRDTTGIVIDFRLFVTITNDESRSDETFFFFLIKNFRFVDTCLRYFFFFFYGEEFSVEKCLTI